MGGVEEGSSGVRWTTVMRVTKVTTVRGGEGGPTI